MRKPNKSLQLMVKEALTAAPSSGFDSQHRHVCPHDPNATPRREIGPGDPPDSVAQLHAPIAVADRLLEDGFMPNEGFRAPVEQWPVAGGLAIARIQAPSYDDRQCEDAENGHL